MRILVLLVLAAVSIFGYVALPGESLDTPIAKGSQFTYEQLLKLVFPDLETQSDDPKSGMASESVAIREFDGAGQAAQKETEVPVSSVNTVPADLGPGKALLSFVTEIQGTDCRSLALFDLAGTPRLLDVVQVPAFPDDPGGFSRKVRLNDKTSALIFDAYHHNSDQGYQSRAIVFVHGERIKLISQVALLRYNGGSLGGSFDETATITTLPDPGREFAKVVIRATLKFLADPPDSEHQPRQRASARIYTSTLRWDAAKAEFTEPADGLAPLDKFNKDKY